MVIFNYVCLIASNYLTSIALFDTLFDTWVLEHGVVYPNDAVK